MATVVGVLSLPTGIAFGVWFGRMVWLGQIPRWAVAIFVGMTAGIDISISLLQFADWLVQ